MLQTQWRAFADGRTGRAWCILMKVVSSRVAEAGAADGSGSIGRRWGKATCVLLVVCPLLSVALAVHMRTCVHEQSTCAYAHQSAMNDPVGLAAVVLWHCSCNILLAAAAVLHFWSMQARL